MSTTNIAYAGAATVTISGSTLATSSTLVAGREGMAIDNTSNKYLDALLEVAATANGTPGANTVLNVYVGASSDGTNFTDNATGADAALTIKSPTNLKLIGVLNWSATSNYSVRGFFSAALAFGGILPPYWTVFVVQNSGNALSALTVKYRGITATNA